MRILIISFSVNGSMGANFKVVTRNLSKEHEVSVLTNVNIGVKDLNTTRIYNVKFDRKSPLGFINPISYVKIYRFIKTENFDIAFIYSPHPVNLFIYQIIDNKRLIPFVHDHIQHSGVRRFDAFFTNWQMRYFYNKSAKIIVSCHFIKNEILRLGLMKDASKIEVNYLGLLDNLSFEKEELQEDIDVLFFGRIEYYKGLDVLVEVGKSLPRYKFVIAGKGNLKDTFGIKELPKNFEHFNCYLSDKELATLIQRSKVVVLPYRDATGTQTIQSIFDYSKPVIATSVGCFPEYIEDGIDGIIIPPCDRDALTDSIILLLNNESLRKEMGKNGNKKLSTLFSAESIIKRYIDIFCSICN